MSAKIYVSRHGREHGPYTREQLLEHVRNGQVRLDDRARQEGMARQMTVAEQMRFLGLDPAKPPRATTAHAAPVPESVATAPTALAQGVESPSIQAERNLAPLKARFGAAMVDSLLCSFLAFAVLVAFFGTGVLTDDSDDETALLYLTLSAVQMAYFTLTQSGPQRASLGKRLFGLIVVTSSGQRLSPATAALRSLGLSLTGFAPVLFLIVVAHRQRRALHDLFANTVVLSKT